MLKQMRMTNTDFIVREKSGSSRFTFTPAHRVGASPLGALDAALVVGFMAAFVALILLLAK